MEWSKFWQFLIVIVVVFTFLVIIIKLLDVNLIKKLPDIFKLEFTSRAGLISLAGFIIPFLFVFHKDALMLLNKAVNFVTSQRFEISASDLIIPIELILISFIWLFLDFIFLCYLKKNEK
jgi:hypothetical protein